MTETEYYAAQLEQMVEQRSLENPAMPVSPQQLDLIWGYGPTRAGVQISEHSALTIVAVFSAQKILAESVGMLPMELYEGDANSTSKKRATNNPLYPKIRWQPNEEQTAVTFKETLQGHLAGWGNCYARIIRDGGATVTDLVPMSPDKVQPFREGGRLKYRAYLNGGGQETYYPEEILHIPAFGFDGLKGYSPIAMCRESMALGKAAEIFGSTFFGNGTNLSGVLTAPNKLTPEQRKANLEQWHKLYSGSGNAHMTALLDGGTTYNRIGIPPEDAQFLQTRQFQVLEIARIYRIPPHMLMDLEKGSKANVEQSGIEFLVYTLSPWLEKWEQEFTRKLIGFESGLSIRFDERRLLRSDIQARQQYYAAGKQWGFLNTNDIRGMEGEEPVDGGDIFLTPTNTCPTDMFRDYIKAAMEARKPENKAQAMPESQPGVKPTGRAMVPVFESIFKRVLAKEANARKRASFDQVHFYGEFRQQVKEELMPAVKAMMEMRGLPSIGEPATAITSILHHFAQAEHEKPETVRAGELAEQIVGMIAQVKP